MEQEERGHLANEEVKYKIKNRGQEKEKKNKNDKQKEDLKRGDV